MLTHSVLSPSLSPLVILSTQGIVPGETWHVEMVFDYHDVSDFVVLVQPSCGIRQDDRLDTHQLKDAHGHGDLVHKEQSVI